jgi:hypothetical protein
MLAQQCQTINSKNLKIGCARAILEQLRNRCLPLIAWSLCGTNTMKEGAMAQNNLPAAFFNRNFGINTGDLGLDRD